MPRISFSFVLALRFAASSLASTEWTKLHDQVGGRLYPASPFATPCFSTANGPINQTSCSEVKAGYLDELTRSNEFGAFINTQWETCQSTGAQCLLDSSDPSDAAPAQLTRCELGSISSYYIDVREPTDVAAAFNFSLRTNTTLIVKNTGHDYKGRSSAPNSLALWTHNLKNISYSSTFTPERCTGASSAVTVGAGVQWGEAYHFAEAHNITLVGGSDKSVGVSGGWLQGGGHSVLSNTMGLGVDRVLQFKVVTPDGQFRTVNKCQNSDLFYALRGGGGGTFGVVLESTVLASPQVVLQAVIVSFSDNLNATRQLWDILVENADKWADDSWGGLANANTAIYVTPKLSKSEASQSMAPLIQFGQDLVAANIIGAELVETTFSSYGSFFDYLSGSKVGSVGKNLALASRLIPRTSFKSSSSRSSLVSALMAAEALAPGLLVLMGPPSSFPGDGMTSVNDAWRTSLFHVTVVASWNWNATKAEKQGQYSLVSTAAGNLRAITPDAAYLNEADVYEPNHEVAFWGEHYDKLLEIKRRYDPHHLLDCWHCVGWNPLSPRFACYL